MKEIFFAKKKKKRRRKKMKKIKKTIKLRLRFFKRIKENAI